MLGKKSYSDTAIALSAPGLNFKDISIIALETINEKG